MQAAAERSLDLLQVDELAEKPGQGLTGRVQRHGDGAIHEVAITSRQKFAAIDPARAAVLPPTAGGLECLILVDGEPAGMLRFRDSPRADGKPFVKHLAPVHGLDRVMLVSGDRESEVRWLADVVGIAEIHAGIQPEGKLKIVEELTGQAPTLFVGDGINDAPALAKANVGFAMARGGSDTAIETADVALMDDDLRKIPRFIRLSRATYAILVQNITLALAIKALFFGLTIAGSATMWMAVFADMGTSLLVVANGLRAMKK